MQSANCCTPTPLHAAPTPVSYQASRLIISRRHPFSLVNGSGYTSPARQHSDALRGRHRPRPACPSRGVTQQPDSISKPNSGRKPHDRRVRTPQHPGPSPPAPRGPDRPISWSESSITCAPNCRNTWCRCTGCGWIACRSTPTENSIARRCRVAFALMKNQSEYQPDLRLQGFPAT